MCQFFNDRYSRCGHEKEKETIPCIRVQNAMQTKYCPNSKVNTTNTYIEQRCEACKSSNGLVATPIFPEYDYARLTVKRLHPREMYAKPGEKTVFRPSITATEPSPAPSRSATPALNTHGESKKGELTVPNFLMSTNRPRHLPLRGSK